MLTRMSAAACLVLSLSGSARAQTATVPVTPTYGGFGGQYVQTVPQYADPGLVDSRFGTYYYPPLAPIADVAGVPMVQPDGSTIIGQNVAPQVQQPGVVQVPAQKGRRAVRRYQTQAPMPYARGLTQGQVVMPDGSTSPVYAPPLRYQTYGQSYGMGPYGSNVYTQFWHGQMMTP